MNPDGQSDTLVAILLVTDAELQQTGASVSNFVSQVKPSCSYVAVACASRRASLTVLDYESVSFLSPSVGGDVCVCLFVVEVVYVKHTPISLSI